MSKNNVKKNWSLMVYMAADNNLSNAGIDDMREMCKQGVSSKVHVNVEYDNRQKRGGSKRYEISEPDSTGRSHRKIIEGLPEQNSGDPRVLRNFVKWSQTHYPCEKKALVIWSHGTGFHTKHRNIAYDDHGSSLDMNEIDAALQGAGITSSNKLDILGFDACLMNMLEVANHFDGKVDYIVGSQQTEPGDGWPYGRVLSAFKEDLSGRETSGKIVDAYIKDYRRRGTRNVTQSAIDLAKTKEALGALSNLGNLLKCETEKNMRFLNKARSRTQSFKMSDYVDLVHLCSIIEKSATNPRIIQAAQKAAECVDDCTVASGRLGRSVKNANGLSIWFPAYRDLYHRHRSEYLALNFAKKHRGWIDFLDAYHQG